MWIIALGGSLVALAVFLLWVPLVIALEIEVRGRPKLTARYSWLFGLVKFRPGRKERRPSRKVSGRRAPDVGLLLRMLGVKGLAGNFFRLGRGALGSLRLTDLSADFRVGLGDPSDTGMLFAALGPATALLGPAFFNRFKIQPGFEDDVYLEGRSTGTVRLRPIRLVPPVLRFIFSLTAARALWTLITGRFRRRKRRWLPAVFQLRKQQRRGQASAD